jgi:pilus assembly protein CpaF
VSLLRRIEQAQQQQQPATQGEAAGPAMPPSSVKVYQASTRGEQVREIRVHLQEAVAASSASLFAASMANDLRPQVEAIVDRFLATNAYPITHDERMQLVQEVINEVEGLGPLESLLHDDTITEVMVNGPNQVYIERSGKLLRVNVSFLGDEHVQRIIDRIISPLGRRIDQSSPRVDARLPDGSRVNAVIEPISLIGPVITVRKFSARPYTVEDLIRFGTATPEMFEFLRVCIEARLNVFVSGGTGSGKTTTLNVLSSFIPEEERIITIEDAAELQLNQEHVVTLEGRPPNLEGQGEVTTRDLLRNALHMRPDRIIVGECRGGEALDMIQAMTVGQEGSLSTGHANSPADMLRRLETMILMAGYEMPLRTIREQIASAVDLIVHTARLKDGSRKVTAITEVYGIEDDEILTQDIFVFQQTDFVDGKIQGDLRPTGIRPTFMGKFKASGIELPPGEFGIPPADPNNPTHARHGKGRMIAAESTGPAQVVQKEKPKLGLGRVKAAGGMVYVSSIGPVDLETGELAGTTTRLQATRCMENLKARLESVGSSLDKVVMANWSLKDPADFDTFSEVWARWFPGEAPVGQLIILPPQMRQAGFRVAIGVIAEA